MVITAQTYGWSSEAAIARCAAAARRTAPRRASTGPRSSSADNSAKSQAHKSGVTKRCGAHAPATRLAAARHATAITAVIRVWVFPARAKPRIRVAPMILHRTFIAQLDRFCGFTVKWR